VRTASIIRDESTCSFLFMTDRTPICMWPEDKRQTYGILMEDIRAGCRSFTIGIELKLSTDFISVITGSNFSKDF
jgi:hypothetical protein